MKSVGCQDYEMMPWGNLATAISYYIITSQLLLFMRNPKVVRIFYDVNDAKDCKKRHIFWLLLATAVLFAAFICLCGTGHLMNVFVVLYPDSYAAKQTRVVVMWLTSIVSFFTALVGFPLFPTIADAIQGLELNMDGKFQLTGSYLIEVVDLIKESILLLSDDLVVRKCNDVSKVLFGADIIGTSICEYVHPADLPVLNGALAEAAENYTFGATTIEVRIEHESSTGSPKFSSLRQTKQSNRRRRNSKNYKVYTTDSPPFAQDGDIEMGESTPLNADKEAQCIHDEYIWIEVTVFRGKGVQVNGAFEQDIKLVCRNIDDRKKRQTFHALVESTEERARINEAKLRYVSCIAHDLKTPLQSFTYSLDLLNETDLHPEQRELVEHASVAIDLMKLTISQTMDISKALTGAKLMPRRTTVYLSSVLNRVKIIINGYGKQVPVSFEVAPDVCDEIITDEEWLWQMLLNLLTNACKYTDRGSICVRLLVMPENSERMLPRMGESAPASAQNLSLLDIPKVSSDMLLCEVIDTGIGISPEKIDHIFDAFAQVQEGQVTGTGLGLFGVRTRAEGLLGTCGARHNTESSTGTGTVLWFALPYVPDVDINSAIRSDPCSPNQSHISAGDAFRSLQGESVPPPPTSTPATEQTCRVSYEPCPRGSPNVTHNMLRSINTKFADARSSGNAKSPHRASSVGSNQTSAELLIRSRQLTAMVVEDTPTVRKLMQKLLLSMGFESVVCYENGSKGLEAMMAAPVDIVFSDVQMPIMTGPEMVRRFRKWETSGTVQSRSSDAPDQSMAFNASHSNSFKTASDVCEPKNTSFDTAESFAPRKRQLIVAVTANSAECEKVNSGGFDEICAKPLTRADIYKIITRNFHYE